jgi:type I restriction enzyme S subunit
MAPLTEIADVNPPKPQADALTDDAIVTFVPMAAVDAENGTINAPADRRFRDVLKRYTAFADGDVLLAKITPCFENGKAAVARNLKNGLGFGSSEFHVIRPSEGVVSEYLYYYVRQESLRQAGAEHMTSTAGQARVPVHYIRTLQIPVPPLPEQRRIVAAIATFVAGFRSIQARLERAGGIIRRLRQAALAAMYSGRLTHDWRRAHQNERPRVQDRPLEESDAAPLLPEFPDEWLLTTVGAIAERIQYGTSIKADEGSGIPILRMGNIQEGGLDLTQLKYVSTAAGQEAFFVREGDILFNRTNSPELVGKAAVVYDVSKMLFASYLIRVRVNPEVAVPEYVCSWINSPWGKQWARAVRTDGVSQSNINSSKLAAMPIPLPSLGEQAEAVRQLRTLLDTADAIEGRVVAAARRVEKVVQAVLGKAFSGDLVPTEAELARADGRSYQPAELLLDRIREGREQPDGALKIRSPTWPANSRPAGSRRHSR